MDLCECKKCQHEFKEEIRIRGVFVMSIAELFKKNFVLIPVIASVLFGTFTGVKYIVNLTDTINDNQNKIINLKRDLTTCSRENFQIKTQD